MAGEKKQEKVFSTTTEGAGVGRETRFDKRQRRRKEDASVGGAGERADRPAGEVVCPMPGCNAPDIPESVLPTLGGLSAISVDVQFSEVPTKMPNLPWWKG